MQSRISTRRRSRIGGATLANPTFSRTGVAYLDGVSHAENAARFPAPGGVKGVLVEEATTNIALQSEALTTSPWTASGHTLTAAPSPRGDNSAWRIQSNTTSGNVVQAVAVTAGTKYTLSFYAKDNGGSDVRYRVYDNTNAAEVVAATSYKGGLSASEFRRVSVTFTAPTGCTSAGIYLSSYASGTVDVIAWGVQLEAKGYPTTYIPTLAASVARNAEGLSVPSAGLMKPASGAVIVRAYLDGDLIAAGPQDNHYAFACTAGAPFGDLFGLRISVTTGNPTVFFNGTGQSVSAAMTRTQGWATFGARWSASALSLHINGSSAATLASPSMPTAFAASLHIGQIGGGAWWDHPIAFVAVYDRALSDAEMTQATTATTPESLPAGYTALFDFRAAKIETAKRRGIGVSDLLTTYYQRA